VTRIFVTRQDLSGKRLVDRDSAAHDAAQDPNTEVGKVLRLTLNSKPARAIQMAGKTGGSSRPSISNHCSVMANTLELKRSQLALPQ
jgi:hypothetical protein